MNDTPEGPYHVIKDWWAVISGAALVLAWVLRWASGMNNRLDEHATRLLAQERANIEMKESVATRATHADVRVAIDAMRDLGADIKEELRYLRRRLDGRIERKDDV